MSTFMASAKLAAENSRWHVIDAEGRVLGRIATVAARLLQGKHKPTYTPFLDTGDHVVVVNAAKVKLTGRKEDQKIYRQHSGYEGGLREERARLVRKRHPERLVEEAVHGMLPKGTLGQAMYRKLKVYAVRDHRTRAKPSAPRSRNGSSSTLRKPDVAIIDRPAAQRAASTSTSTKCPPFRRDQTVTGSPKLRTFDILAIVAGWPSGQVSVIARALVEYNGELRKALKNDGLLTRDARAKERKKYGMAGARKRFQFSKR